ncbi:prepilin [Cupriavidus sp. CV2]|uniref:prepilin n=1 Tax=Cupriavidus ulmosensis TaxID=3065913 RepID=UPI00296AEE93|nr:prepilin [Cupriavidus sp. CV2]MDW3683267.1 prepilin [Cupriavidus sp. CV2]
MSFRNSLKAAQKQLATPPGVALLLLMAIATPAAAADAGFLSNLSATICGIATFFNTTFLFVAGVIIIVLAAVGIANAESTIMKFVSFAGVGIGIASASVSILKNFGIGAVCPGF